MTLHEQLTEEIRSGPSGPHIGAFFDLDQTLLAGFSATSFVQERLLSGRMAPRELADTLLGAFGFLGIKAVEYEHKWKHGLLWGKHYESQEGHGETQSAAVLVAATEGS